MASSAWIKLPHENIMWTRSFGRFEFISARFKSHGAIKPDRSSPTVAPDQDAAIGDDMRDACIDQSASAAQSARYFRRRHTAQSPRASVVFTRQWLEVDGSTANEFALHKSPKVNCAGRALIASNESLNRLMRAKDRMPQRPRFIGGDWADGKPSHLSLVTSL